MIDSFLATHQDDIYNIFTYQTWRYLRKSKKTNYKWGWKTIRHLLILDLSINKVRSYAQLNSTCPVIVCIIKLWYWHLPCHMLSRKYKVCSGKFHIYDHSIQLWHSLISETWKANALFINKHGITRNATGNWWKCNDLKESKIADLISKMRNSNKLSWKATLRRGQGVCRVKFMLRALSPSLAFYIFVMQDFKSISVVKWSAVLHFKILLYHHCHLSEWRDLIQKLHSLYLFKF